MASLGRTFDGAYNIVFLDGMGRMFVARDPLGLRPLSYAVQGRLFAAASESVALTNMGFTDIRHIEPGEMAIIEKGRLRFERFARPRRHAHCFFEWVYFSNVASTSDGFERYLARAARASGWPNWKTGKWTPTASSYPSPTPPRPPPTPSPIAWESLASKG